MVGGRMCRLVWWPNFRLPFCRQLVIESLAMRWLLIIALSASAWAQTAPFAPPEDISFRRANIISEGTRMSAEVFAPKASADKRLSTIRELIAKAETIESPQRIVLDMDSTEIPVYGQQEQSAYNGHFESTCYHPLLLFS